jgi:hypothetical protein
VFFAPHINCEQIFDGSGNSRSAYVFGYIVSGVIVNSNVGTRQVAQGTTRVIEGDENSITIYYFLDTNMILQIWAKCMHFLILLIDSILPNILLLVKGAKSPVYSRII